MKESDKINKKLTLSENPINPTYILKQNDIICPKCKEQYKYDIKNYRIKLYDCKNNHITENIKTNEYENTQNIIISNSICDICKNNIFNAEIFICNKCKMNLCNFCISKHDNNHQIINYEEKDFICYKHDKMLIKYCQDCDKDMCTSCL